MAGSPKTKSSVLISDILILVRFGFGIQGSGICSEGEIITDRTLCEDACRELDLPQKEILDNFKCYKDGAGNCYQNGHHGAGASLICNQGKHIKTYKNTFKQS